MHHGIYEIPPFGPGDALFASPSLLSLLYSSRCALWNRPQFSSLLDRREETRETEISGTYVHTALVKMDNIGGEGKVQIREHWLSFLKGTIVFSFPLL